MSNKEIKLRVHLRVLSNFERRIIIIINYLNSNFERPIIIIIINHLNSNFERHIIIIINHLNFLNNSSNLTMYQSSYGRRML